MLRWLKKRSRLAFASGLSVGLLIGAGMLVGAWATRVQTPAQLPFPSFPLPSQVNAAGSHGGLSFAMCTGPIYEGIEGLFILDYLSGEIQCWVPNGRSGMLGGLYKHNVMVDLGVEAGSNNKPSFVMVTGAFSLRSGFAGNVRPAECVLYVGDVNTGAWVAYMIPWDRTIANMGSMQAGKLVKVGGGRCRDLAIRD
ncbi:MAG: hypothetical protein ACKOBW_12235 [Planctomycetota bacterium]